MMVSEFKEAHDENDIILSGKGDGNIMEWESSHCCTHSNNPFVKPINETLRL